MLDAKQMTPALVLLTVVLLGATQAAPALDPTPFEATYVLKARGFAVGETRWSVERVGDGFIYESRTTATGIAALFGNRGVVERSEWKFFAGNIKPARYRYERHGRPDKTTAIEFDWEDGVVHNDRRGIQSRIAVPDDTLDKLGYMLMLADDLRAGKRSVRYNIADGKSSLKVYDFRVISEEQMETAMGTMKVLKMIRDRKDKERETTIWTAPALDFLPVRIMHRERDGEELTISIRSLTTALSPKHQENDADGVETPSRRDSFH